MTNLRDFIKNNTSSEKKKEKKKEKKIGLEEFIRMRNPNSTISSNTSPSFSQPNSTVQSSLKQPVSYLKYTGTPSAELQNKIADIDNKINSIKSSWSATDKSNVSRYKHAGIKPSENYIADQGKISSLEKQKREYSNQLKAAVKQEEYIGKYNGYLSNTANTDYTDRSAYKTTVKNLSDNELKAQGWKKAEDGKWYKSHGETATFYSGDGDDTYEYINNPKARTTLDANMISASGGVTNYYRDQGLDLLSSEEKGIYNYLYSESKEKADEFLKFLSPTLQSRSIERTKKKVSEIAEDSPVAASLYSIYSNLENGAIMPAKMVAAATGTYEDNPGLDIFDAQTKAIRGTVGEMADKTALGSVEIPVINKKLGSFLYGTGMSVADMGAAAFLSGGNGKAMQAVMSSSAGSSAMTEAKENGADDSKALILGIGSAFIEAVTEKYSIEALFSKPKSAVNYFLKNVVAEGTEEGASDILNTVLDEVVSAIDGSQSQIRSDISALVENEGLTEKEASKRVMLSWFQDLGADMLGGSISGAVMSAPQTASAAYNESRNSHYKKGVYSTMMTDSGTAAGIKSMPNSREITKGTKAVYDAAVKASVLGADTIRQGLYDELDKKGYTPESAALNEINKALGYENYTLSKLKLDGEMKGALESAVEKLAVAFDAGYFSERFDDVSGAMNAYAKAAAAGQAVGAYMLAERAVNADSKKANELIKRARKLLPGVKAGQNIEQSAEYIKTAARMGLDNINQTTADLRVDYLEDIVKAVGDAVMKENVRLDETQRRAINDTVLNGNVSANIDTILGDESLTNILSDVFGMYIDGDTSVPAIENKVKGMIAAYRSGNGKRHQAVVNSRKLRMDMISLQLTGKGINDPEIFAGFRNAVFNGALTEDQAKAILYSEDAFNIFVKSTNGGITTKSGVEDMIKAAGLVAGFDLSLDSSAEYVDSGIKEVVNGRADVPLNETGIYDPDTGRLILNEKAEPQKKLSYTLAQHVVRDDFDSGNSNKYSYKELLKKPDILIPKISEISEDKFNEYKAKKADFINDAVKKARLTGNSKNTDTATYLRCDDLNEDILIGQKSFRHGAARVDKTYVNICFNLPDIIKNSIVVNELSPRKDVSGSIALLGVAETSSNYILVRTIVNNRTWKAEDYKAVYAIRKQSIKKEDVGVKPQDYTASGGSQTSSTISISNLLEIVKDKKLINSVLSDDVLKNLQAERIVDENVTKNLVNDPESLADRLLDYIRILNIDLSDELKRAARKYNSYTLGNQARLNGTMLSEDNLQREIVADWLANAFLNEDTIEQLVTDDMSLAMELFERVSVELSKTSVTEEYRRLTENVRDTLYSFINEDFRAEERDEVLGTRRNNGKSVKAFVKASDRGRIGEKNNHDEGFVDNVKDVWRSFKRAWVDSGEAINRIAKMTGNNTIYHMYNNAKQYRNTVNMMLTEHQTDFDGNTVGKSLADIFKPYTSNKELMEDFELYLQYMNNYDRYNNDTQFWTTSKRETLYRAKDLEKLHPEFVQSAKEVYEYCDNLLDWRLKSGLISKEQYDAMKKNNSHYVPAFPDNSKSLSASSSPTRVSSVVKKAKKNKNKDVVVANVLDSLKSQTQQVVKEARINVLVNEMLDSLVKGGLILKTKDGYEFIDGKTTQFLTQVTEIEDNNTYDMESSENAGVLEPVGSERRADRSHMRIAFFIDGVRHTADIIDRGVYEGLKHIEYSPDAKKGFAPFRSINTVFKKLVTSWNPFFGIRNFFRDLGDAVLFSQDTPRLLKNLPLAYAQMIKNGELWQMYCNLGGIGDSFYNFDELLTPGTEQLNHVEKIKEAFIKFNLFIEQAPRLAEFMSVMEKGGNSYENKMKALHAAADVTVNFGRSGMYAKLLNSTVVPFYNPGVQGASKFVRVFTETKGLKKWVYLSFKLATLGFGMAVINDILHEVAKLMWDDDDEEYEQLTDYQKQNNFLFRVAKGEYLKIPKGRAAAAVGIVTDGVIDTVKGEKTDWPAIIKTAVDQLKPSSPFSDSIFSPIINAKNNKTWYGGEIESAADKNVKASQRYDENTDYFSRYIGKALNISPKKVHYVLDAYSGVIGDFVLPLFTPKDSGNPADVLLRSAKGSFVVDSTTSNRISSDYYNLIDNLTYEKNDKDNEENIASTITLRYLSSQTKALYDLYDEIHKINSGSSDPAVKAEKSRETKAIINGIMLNAIATNEDVYEVAENMSSEYAYKKDNKYFDEAGDELTYDNYIDIIYREVNRKVFGAEYALKVYNDKVYEKAAEAVNDGATFDLYYDAYFGIKNIEGNIDFEKGGIETGSARKNKWNYINALDASKVEKSVLATNLFDISEDKIKKATLHGISEYEYINFVCDTGVYKTTSGSTKKERTLAYINKMNISSKQKDALYLISGYSEKTLYSAPWH